MYFESHFEDLIYEKKERWLACTTTFDRDVERHILCLTYVSSLPSVLVMIRNIHSQFLRSDWMTSFANFRFPSQNANCEWKMPPLLCN